MPPKVKKPKVKKEKKPRVTQKQKQTQIVTVNVTAPDKPKRKRKAKPKVKAGFDPRAAGISGPVGTIGGLTPVIYAPTQPKQNELFLDDAFKKYIKNLYTQQPQQNPLLPPSAPDLLPIAPAQPGTPALLPSAPPNVPRLGADPTPASPLAPPPPNPSPLAASTSDESQSPSVFGSTMSLAGDAINEPPIDPLMTEDEAANMFISELAKQADDQSRVIAPPKPPSLDDLMKQDPLARGDSDVSTLTADEGGAEEPPKPAVSPTRKPRAPNKTAEQKAQEKAERDAAKQAKEDERAAALAAKVRGGGGGQIRMGF